VTGAGLNPAPLPPLTLLFSILITVLTSLARRGSVLGLLAAYTMSIRAYKITIFGLAAVIVWLGWFYWCLWGQIVTGGFVSHQAVPLREDVKYASEGIVLDASNGVMSMSDREIILNDLNWYINYFDHHTNTLARSPVLGFLWIERGYVVRDAIAYLRKTGTNDYGDDPYEWLKREHAN